MFQSLWDSPPLWRATALYVQGLKKFVYPKVRQSKCTIVIAYEARYLIAPQSLYDGTDFVFGLSTCRCTASNVTADSSDKGFTSSPPVAILLFKVDDCTENTT